MADLAIRLLVEQLVVLSLNEITTDYPISSDDEEIDIRECRVPSAAICVARCEYIRILPIPQRERVGQSVGSFHGLKNCTNQRVG